MSCSRGTTHNVVGISPEVDQRGWSFRSAQKRNLGPGKNSCTVLPSGVGSRRWVGSLATVGYPCGRLPVASGPSVSSTYQAPSRKGERRDRASRLRRPAGQSNLPAPLALPRAGRNPPDCAASRSRRRRSAGQRASAAFSSDALQRRRRRDRRKGVCVAYAYLRRLPKSSDRGGTAIAARTCVAVLSFGYKAAKVDFAGCSRRRFCFPVVAGGRSTRCRFLDFMNTDPQSCSSSLFSSTKSRSDFA